MSDASSGVNVSTAGTAQRDRWRSMVSGPQCLQRSAWTAPDYLAVTDPTWAIQVDSIRRLATHQAIADSEPIEPRNKRPTKSPTGCSERIVGVGGPSLFQTGEGCYRQGRTG